MDRLIGANRRRRYRTTCATAVPVHRLRLHQSLGGRGCRRRALMDGGIRISATGFISARDLFCWQTTRTWTICDGELMWEKSAGLFSPPPQLSTFRVCGIYREEKEVSKCWDIGELMGIYLVWPCCFVHYCVCARSVAIVGFNARAERDNSDWNKQ